MVKALVMQVELLAGIDGIKVAESIINRYC